MPIVMAAAFDDDMIQTIAVQIATEVRAFANNGRASFDVWMPNMNPYRDPRWGRGMETPGECNTRIRNYISAVMQGIEGSDPGHPEVVSHDSFLTFV